MREAETLLGRFPGPVTLYPNRLWFLIGLPVSIGTNNVATVTRTKSVIYGSQCLGATRTVTLNGASTSVARNLCNTNDSFGYITSSRDPRQMQFGLKLTF